MNGLQFFLFATLQSLTDVLPVKPPERSSDRFLSLQSEWAGERLLQWHREKAGTIEHVHDEVKKALGGGHMPTPHFNANAAWFKLSLIAYNIVNATRRLCLEPQDRNVRLKKFRLLVIHLAGRMSRFQCTLRLRF